MLDDAEPRPSADLDVPDNVPDDVLLLLVEQLSKRFDEEEERRSRVEAKATSLLLAIGLAVTLGSSLLFASFRAEFAADTVKAMASVAVLFTLAGLMYLAKAAWHALRALARAEYCAIGAEDLLRPDALRTQTSLQRVTASEYAKCSILNRAATNAKVDHVHLAQLLVRNALGAFFFVAILSTSAVWLVPVKKAVPPPALSVETCPPPTPAIVSCVFPPTPVPTAATPVVGAVASIIASTRPIVRKPGKSVGGRRP
jgi:hypothetical protein